jgi:hypothetical protein
MKIRFYNREGKWYADIPDYIESGGTEEECEMIFGSDTWLDFLSNNGKNIFLEVSTNKNLQETLSLIEKDEYGGTYIAETYNGKRIDHKLWICPVTLFLFGEYPTNIYYEVIK